MKTNFLLALLALASIPFISSCDEDEPKPATITFEKSEDEITESDGTIASFHPLLIQNATGQEVQVKVVLNKPARAKSVIQYSVSGTASENSTQNPLGDFEIDGNGENFTIEKGESEAIITLRIYEDYDFELDDELNLFETIEITLESVVSGPVKLGEEVTYTLSVFEDDTYVYLEWEDNDPNVPVDDVDMDLFLWLDGDFLGGSDYHDEIPYEYLSIPGGFPDGDYEMSYTYYAGTSSNVAFDVEIFDAGGTLDGDDVKNYSKVYDMDNLNTYADYDNENPPVVEKVQGMTKNGFDYENVTDITVPATGSRMATAKVSALALKQKPLNYQLMNRLREKLSRRK